MMPPPNTASYYTQLPFQQQLIYNLLFGGSNVMWSPSIDITSHSLQSVGIPPSTTVSMLRPLQSTEPRAANNSTPTLHNQHDAYSQQRSLYTNHPTGRAALSPPLPQPQV